MSSHEGVVHRCTREEFYKQVWEYPSVVLARRWGVSDRYIGTLCERFLVPKPPRGYWAKASGGIRTRQPSLPKVNDPDLEMVVIQPSQRPTPAALASRDPEVAAFVSCVQAPGRLRTPETADQRHPATARTARSIACCQVEWRGADRGLLRTPRRRRDRVVDIRCAPQSRDRALRLADALLTSLDALSERSQVKVLKGRSHLVSSVCGVRFEFSIRETTRRVRIRRTPGARRRSSRSKGHEPRYRYAPTGRLEIRVRFWPGGWSVLIAADSSTRPVETKLGDALTKLAAEVSRHRAASTPTVHHSRHRAESLRMYRTYQAIASTSAELHDELSNATLVFASMRLETQGQDWFNRVAKAMGSRWTPEKCGMTRNEVLAEIYHMLALRICRKFEPEAA